MLIQIISFLLWPVFIFISYLLVKAVIKKNGMEN